MQPQVIFLLLIWQLLAAFAVVLPRSYPGTGICCLGSWLNALWEYGMLGLQLDWLTPLAPLLCLLGRRCRVDKLGFINCPLQMQLLLAFKSLVAPFRFPAGFDYLVINMRVLPIWLGAKRAKGRKFTGLKRVRIIHKKKRSELNWGKERSAKTKTLAHLVALFERY